MVITNIDDANHMDIAVQIDNDWSRDSILAFANKQKKSGYTIRFRNHEKTLLKKTFINSADTNSAKRHNKKIINLVFGYMIFKIIQEIKIPIRKVIICPDHRPTREVHHYIQKISVHLGKPNLTSDVDISFINRNQNNIPRSTSAHRLAKKTLKGKKKANSVVNWKELEEIIKKLL